MKNSEQSAFPEIKTDKKYHHENGVTNTYGNTYSMGGLTKREYFAAMAMQGIIAGFDPESKTNGCYIPMSEYPLLMMQAHQMADELLKQLEK